MDRKWGMRSAVEMGLGATVLRELTAAEHSPYDPPYVSPDEATALMVGYIEKFVPNGGSASAYDLLLQFGHAPSRWPKD